MPKGVVLRRAVERRLAAGAHPSQEKFTSNGPLVSCATYNALKMKVRHTASTATDNAYMLAVLQRRLDLTEVEQRLTDLSRRRVHNTVVLLISGFH